MYIKDVVNHEQTRTGSKLMLIPIEMEELLHQVRDVVRSEIQAKQEHDIAAKLLAPSEVCQLFSPKISKVTLHKWTKDGRLQEHRIGGRIYYKYSEVIDSLQTLKKYQKSL